MKTQSDVLYNGRSKGDLRTKLRSFRKRGRKGGFTLVELIVCIVIVLVLAAVAVPLLMGYIERSGEAADMASARTACVEVVTAAASGDTSSPLYYGGNVYLKEFKLAQGNSGWATDVNNASVGGVSKSDEEHWLNEPQAGGYCRVYISNNELYINWGGQTYINPISAKDFLTKEKLEKILSGSNYEQYLNSNDPSQNSAIQKIRDYATEHGFNLEADYGATTWQIIPTTSANGSILNQPAIYWSTVDVNLNNKNKNIPVMGYRNGRYDVWYSQVEEAKAANGETYYRLKNGFANVNNSDNSYGNNMGGSATFQFDNYEEAKAKYDELMKKYNEKGYVTGSDASGLGL